MNKIVATCLAVLLLAAVTALPAAEPQPGDALDRFISRLEKKQEKQVKPIIKNAGTNSQARAEALLESLLALNPDLTAALDELNYGRPDHALPILDKLTDSPDPFVAAHASWFRVRAFIGLERYEDAMDTLTSMQPNAVEHTLLSGDMLYTEGCLHACLLDNPRAAETLQRYLKQFPQAPAERRGAANEMLTEVGRVRKETLPYVALLMNESRRRLTLADTGEATQARQQQIQETLTLVIENAEFKPTKGGSHPTPGDGKPKSGKPPDKTPTKGAKESKLRDTAPDGPLHRPGQGGDPDAWAKAYDRDRETIQKELRTRTPERYRNLIEQYYRSLAAEGK